MLPPYGVKCLLHISLTSSVIRSIHSCLATGQGKVILVVSFISIKVEMAKKLRKS